jgi:lipopolysaccharide/colanic/teichoic acid biosynthesis glycosyltransferase
MPSITSWRKPEIPKRLFDVVGAAVGLAVLAIPFVAIAIAISLDTPGPVLFRQVRIGLSGRPFRIFKFRTMTDKRAANAGITTSVDDHVTSVGRFLRATKLDEVPQLINVLRGEMSIVGPRPEVPHFVEKYSDENKRIVLSVRPGLTDFASVVYRRENELLAAQQDPLDYYERIVMPAKLTYCRFYVRRASLPLDLYLIALTVVARGSDAMGGRAHDPSAARPGGRQRRPRLCRPLGRHG